MKKLFVLLFLFVILGVALVAADHDDDHDDDHDYDGDDNNHELSHSSPKNYDDDTEYEDDNYVNWDISDDFIITKQDLSLLTVELTPILDVPINNLSTVVLKKSNLGFVELVNRIDLFVNHTILNNSLDFESSDNSVLIRTIYSSDVAKKSFSQRLFELFGGK